LAKGPAATGVTDADAEDAELFPIAFVAVTVKVYAVPFVNPETTIGLVAPVPVNPPGEEVTVYPVIADPPFEAGALNATETCAFPKVPTAAVGAPGTVAGVTDADAEDAEPFPIAFVAVTVNVYAVPFVNPETTIGDDDPDPVNPPGEEVTVYPVFHL